MNRKIITSKGPAILLKGTPMATVPKTYKRVTVLSHNIGGGYNSDIFTLYLAKDKTYRYEIYRDGSFYPYYGKIVFESKRVEII